MKLFLIGGSAGSIEVLLKVLPGIKPMRDFALVIVLHRKSSADSSLADLFSQRTQIHVKEIEDKEVIQPGVIYIAPADYHVLFEKSNCFSLDFSEKVNYSRPSIDVAFESASDMCGSRLGCLLISGANADGAKGLKIVKTNGGRIAVQDPSTAESTYMPQQAILENEVEHILKIEEMADFINSM